VGDPARAWAVGLQARRFRLSLCPNGEHIETENRDLGAAGISRGPPLTAQIPGRRARRQFSAGLYGRIRDLRGTGVVVEGLCLFARPAEWPRARAACDDAGNYALMSLPGTRPRMGALFAGNNAGGRKLASACRPGPYHQEGPYVNLPPISAKGPVRLFTTRAWEAESGDGGRQTPKKDQAGRSTTVWIYPPLAGAWPRPAGHLPIRERVT